MNNDNKITSSNRMVSITFLGNKKVVSTYIDNELAKEETYEMIDGEYILIDLYLGHYYDEL